MLRKRLRVKTRDPRAVVSAALAARTAAAHAPSHIADVASVSCPAPIIARERAEATGGPR